VHKNRPPVSRHARQSRQCGKSQRDDDADASNRTACGSASPEWGIVGGLSHNKARHGRSEAWPPVDSPKPYTFLTNTPLHFIRRFTYAL